MRQKHHFSAEYKELVGKKNLHNLNPFSSYVRDTILALMVELSCMYKKPVNEILPKLDKAPLYDANYTHYCDGYEFRFDLEVSPCPLEWRFIYSGNSSFRNGWCEFYANFNNIPIQQAHVELAKLFGINTQYPQLSQFQIINEFSFLPHVKTPSEAAYLGNGFELNGINYSKTEEYDFLGAQGFSLFKVIMFESDNGQEIQLPFTYWARPNQGVSKWLSTASLMLSNYEAPYPLSALDLMEKYSDAIVLLTEDLATAFAINRLLDENIDELRKKFVAVSWFGGLKAFKDVDCSTLKGRKVIFLPIGSKKSYLSTAGFHEACTKADVASFSVAPMQLYRFAFAGELNGNEFKNPFEKYLVENGIALPDCTSEILEELFGNTLSLTSYNRLMNKLGLTQEVQSATSDLIMDYDPDAVEVSISRTIDNLINPEDITAICGPREVGKSMEMLSRAHSLAYEYEVFGFEIEKSRNALLIDGEVGRKKINARRVQLDSIYLPNEVMDDQMKSRLQVISKLDYTSSDAPAMDITNSCWQKIIGDAVPKGGVLFIDNLKTLAPETLKAGSSAFSDLIDWFRKLGREKGVSVVLGHHTDRDGKHASDNHDIERLVQNLIMLSPVEDGGGKVGAQFVGRYEKCKAFPGLTGKKYYAHLPYNAGDPKSGGPWEFKYLDAQGSEARSVAMHPTVEGKTESQSQRFGKILAFLTEQDRPRKLKDIVEAINEKSNTISKDLAALVAAEKVTKTGSGSATKYRIKN